MSAKISKKDRKLLDDLIGGVFQIDPVGVAKEQEKKCKELLDDSDMKARIEELIRSHAHFPTKDIEELCKVKSRNELREGQFEQAGLTLMQYQGLAFRHQILTQYNKRLRKIDAGGDIKKQDSTKDLFADDDDEEEDDRRAVELIRSCMKFQSDDDGIIRSLSELPEEWRVVHLSAEPSSPVDNKLDPKDNFPIIVSVFECGQKKLNSCTIRMEKVDRGGRPSLVDEFDDIFKAHALIYQKTVNFDKSKYATARDDVDNRLRTLVSTMESKWLGFAKVLLLGKPKCTQRESAIAKAVIDLFKKFDLPPKNDLKRFVHSALDGSSLFTFEQRMEACSYISSFKKLNKTEIKEMAKVITAFGDNNPAPKVNRHPIVLILDKEVQFFPFEAMEILSCQPCSRVPSIFYLSALYQRHQMDRKSVTREGVRNDNIYYIINPNNDLKKTQDRLESKFKKEFNLGQGTVGTWPTSSQVESALSEMDAFMYCGHGGRLKTMSLQDIERLNVRAIPLLFGCNSGKLDRIGKAFDPVGVATSYLIASSPCLLGFLWSVTDNDLDEWTIGLLDHWLGTVEKKPWERDFVRAVAQKRYAFSRFINSAATVVYGLPSFFHEN